jgi:NAD(P)-dependent dehydrogenase (short-subunit alcohol dehydrogenase family)
MSPVTGLLEGRTALITGGSRGIGRAIAASFASAGAKVMITARTAADLQSTAESIDGEVAWQQANVSDEAAASKAVEATVREFGRIDVLVNNAATNPYMGPLMGITTGQMSKTVDTNLAAPLRWTQLAWDAWMAANGGVVLNVSSIGGFTVERDIGYYNASKAALIHMTRQLAVELGPQVRVVGIAPGLVKTEMAAALWDGREDLLAARIPRGRLGTPLDIGSAALFLSSSAADWITGTTLTVDGGMHLASDGIPQRVTSASAT